MKYNKNLLMDILHQGTKQSTDRHILVGHKENLLKQEIKVHWHMHLRREQSKTL